MQKVFGFFKSSVHFFKIIAIFLILMLLIYWIEDLAKTNFDWLNFIKPVLSSLVSTGEHVSSGSWMLFEAKFEFKYGIALLILLGLYYFVNLIIAGIEKLEELFDDGRRVVKKIQEHSFNDSLAKKQTSEQTKIQTYQIYVSASIKKKFSHRELNINLEEQLNIMNKFLMEKTSVIPEKFENGFLYTFNCFDNVDSTLEIFFKLLKAQTPLNYIICVQISEKNSLQNLKKLIGLNFENKISMLSSTSYRYKFNKAHRYGTSQLGLFQKENDTCEAWEFIEI